MLKISIQKGKELFLKSVKTTLYVREWETFIVNLILKKATGLFQGQGDGAFRWVKVVTMDLCLRCVCRGLQENLSGAHGGSRGRVDPMDVH